MENERTIPTQCHLWKDEHALNAKNQDGRRVFEHLKTYADESHFMRDLCKCTDCGQLYFIEFTEHVDWIGGNDAQYSTYIPVASVAEADEMSALSPLELLRFSPRIQKDFPSDAQEPTIKWIGR